MTGIDVIKPFPSNYTFILILNCSMIIIILFVEMTHVCIDDLITILTYHIIIPHLGYHSHDSNEIIVL